MIVKQIKIRSVDRQRAIKVLNDYGWDFEIGAAEGPFEYFEISLWDIEDFETVVGDLQKSRILFSQVNEKILNSKTKHIKKESRSMYNVRLYFDKPIDEKGLQSILNSEFDMDEVTLVKIDDDKNGVRYALVSVSDDIPVKYLKTLGDRRYQVISVVKEEKKMRKEQHTIELPEDIEIDGQIFKAGTKVQVQEKKSLKESHSLEIASYLSKVRFDIEDSMDVMYIAEDIFTGIVNGIGESRYISDSIKDDVLEQMAYMFDDYE